MKDKYKKKKKPVSYKVRRKKTTGIWVIIRNGKETYHMFGNEIDAQYFMRDLIKKEKAT